MTAAKTKNKAKPTVTTEWTPCIKLPVVVHVRKQRKGEKHISTREGITPLKPDDYIIKGIYGEEYPIAKDIFYKTYSLDLGEEEQEDVVLTEVLEERQAYQDANAELIKAIIVLAESYKQLVSDVQEAAVEYYNEQHQGKTAQ